MNQKRLVIGGDLSAVELRRLARREPDRAAAARMQAIAGALEGLTRAEAARLAGMERQALRDAVLRYNVEGLASLHDRPRPGSKPRLDETRRSALRQLILAGPEVETTGLSAWTLGELCQEVEARWGVGYHEDLHVQARARWACHGKKPGPRIPRPPSDSSIRTAFGPATPVISRCKSRSESQPLRTG